MSELATVLISASVGFASSALLMYVRDIHLYKKRTRELHRRAIIEMQLEKLYSPLYRFIKTSEFLLGKSTLGYAGRATEGREAPEKAYLDSIIGSYLYLADDDLMALLPKIYGVGFYQEKNKESIEQIVKLVLVGYERLRKEYYAYGGISSVSNTTQSNTSANID